MFNNYKTCGEKLSLDETAMVKYNKLCQSSTINKGYYNCDEVDLNLMILAVKTL